MVRKVELDLLEEAGATGEDAPLAESDAKRKDWRRWFAGKRLVVTAAVLGFLCIIGVSLLFLLPGRGAHIESGESVEMASVRDNVETLNNFIIDLADEHGRYRILVCDMTLVLNEDKNISADKMETRRKTYEALKVKARYALISSKSYSIIKQEMRDEMDRVLGGGVKEVYFTKFMLL
ncbi:MAG TPA: flagellar basal body-associated FliL family protein [Syntrophales bacterium]|nr:flagellar basal body-associated FliL family protein [Syntrophales bacterium]